MTPFVTSTFYCEKNLHTEQSKGKYRGVRLQGNDKKQHRRQAKSDGERGFKFQPYRMGNVLQAEGCDPHQHNRPNHRKIENPQIRLRTRERYKRGLLHGIAHPYRKERQKDKTIRGICYEEKLGIGE